MRVTLDTNGNEVIKFNFIIFVKGILSRYKSHREADGSDGLERHSVKLTGAVRLSQ